MRRAKGVIGAFSALREAAQATQLAQTGHALAPPRQNFVRVSLVTDVPDDAVVGGVEDVMQCNRQLHRAQVGAQMPAGRRDIVQHAFPQFIGQGTQLGAGQAAQIGRVVDVFEQTRHRNVSCLNYC